MNTNPVPLVVGDHLTTFQLKVTIALMAGMLERAMADLTEVADGGEDYDALWKAYENTRAASRFLQQVTRLLDGEDRATVHLPRRADGTVIHPEVA